MHFDDLTNVEIFLFTRNYFARLLLFFDATLYTFTDPVLKKCVQNFSYLQTAISIKEYFFIF